MSDQRLFGKRLGDLKQRDQSDPNKTLEDKLPVDIDPVILEGLDDIEKRIVIEIANHSYEGIPHSVRNDFADRAPNSDEGMYKYEEDQLAALCYKVYQESDAKCLVEGKSLAELAEQVMDPRVGHTFSDSVDEALNNIKDRFSFSEIEEGRDNFGNNLFLYKCTVSINPRYVKRVNTKSLTPYLATLIRELKGSLIEENTAGESIGEINYSDYKRIGGSNTCGLRLIEVLEQHRIPIEGDLQKLREDLQRGLHDDLDESLGNFVDLDNAAERKELDDSDDRLGYLSDAGYVLGNIEKYYSEIFTATVEGLYHVPNLVDRLRNFPKAGDEREELAYLRKVLELE